MAEAYFAVVDLCHVVTKNEEKNEEPNITTSERLNKRRFCYMRLPFLMTKGDLDHTMFVFIAVQ